MSEFTRRGVLGLSRAAALAATIATPAIAQRNPDIIIVGAGVFGAWTARELQRAGRQVLLLDAWGPAHARASSGGESRMTRGSYGADEVYTRMAVASLQEWSALSSRTEMPIFHPCGVLFFFQRNEEFVQRTVEVHRRLHLPTQLLERRDLRRRFPQMNFDGVEVGLFEPQFGALMARRAVQSLVAEFTAAGGSYRRARVVMPDRARGGPLELIRVEGGERLSADRFVFACGSWLPKLFPDILRTRIFPTRQEIFFFAPPPGDNRFGPDQLPGWADFNGGDIFYGFPDLETRGFKIAHDKHGPPIDPDVGDRSPSSGALEEVRAFMARRFPPMAGRPLNEARVCHYENSANGDLLIDFHPRHSNLLLVGAGSGHGFKHGPAVGQYAADLLLGRLRHVEPRFSLKSKAETQGRAVH